jgi:plastocyanin
MSNTDTELEEASLDELRLPRRTLMRAAGAGTLLAAGGGLAAAAAAQSDEDDEEGASDDENGRPEDDDGTNQPPSTDPVFGFASIAADVPPPVEPDHEVELLVRPVEGRPTPEFFYEPCGLYVDPGETVKFTYTTPHHTVTAYHPARGEVRRVPEGVPPFSSPVLNRGAYWLYTFEVPGVYDLYCGPHEAFGHVMRVVVGTTAGFEPLPDLCAAPPEGDSETGDEGSDNGGDDSETGDGGGPAEPELRAPLFTGYTVLSDPMLDPETIVERGSVSWDELAAESKQLFLRVEGFPPCAPSDD